LCKLDDQDRVLGRQADDGDEPHLGMSLGNFGSVAMMTKS
jgi:hypothetical protein